MINKMFMSLAVVIVTYSAWNFCNGEISLKAFISQLVSAILIVISQVLVLRDKKDKRE
jgi:hypothetical protein